MLLRVLVAVVGVVLVAAGLVLSPFPWLALLWTGGVCVTFGLLSEVGNESSVPPPR